MRSSAFYTPPLASRGLRHQKMYKIVGSRVYHYVAMGLSIASEIALPGFEASDGARCDVEITCASVPTELERATASGPTWQLTDERLLLAIPGIARFLLTGGRAIAIDAEPAVPRDELAIFLIETVLGILLHQRGAIALHASAVEVDGRAVLFLGPSTAGKSTVAAALGTRGHRLIADDVCAIDLDAGGRAAVHAESGLHRLWSRSITALDLERRSRGPVRAGVEKYYVEPPGEARTGRVEIGAIYVLHEVGARRPPELVRARALEIAALASSCAYRPALVAKLGHTPRYFQALMRIANQAGVFSFTRCLDVGQLPEMVRSLEQHLGEHGRSS